ncbi:DNA mismatch repair protein MutS [Brevibacillus sp. SYP-B805]|uniref:DNA mismatch repair protein MutS n=1 Tax=Brevibacillus sp. SYP-B805 TaxID=1578199 RepID=UPI0013EC55AB|nr:DNA mismatch repair protein MutS [Brevibacillus sp. SYP-B805]NGQ96372.1 DNA mismatch repair protein MutS [Brevibacillus sp. SYP-B805]
MAQYTPMIQQYLAVKRDYPDTFLFFRLGDFYELFFDDAIKASRELEITLTGRDGGGDERIPMCGVPHHSADTYIAQLLQKGYKVAICEQVEDPKEAKGVVRREVTRVITPGTMMEGKWLADKENNYMVAIAELDGRAGVAACDMSTGEMYVTAVGAAGNAALDEALHYRPKELVLYGGLVSRYASDLPSTHLRADEVAEDAAQRQYGEQVAELEPVMVMAVNALLHYIGTTQKRNLSHLRLIKRYEARQFLQMDHFSRRNLELTETLRDKTKKGSLLWLLDRTETAMGGRLLRRWLERPLLNLEEINERLDAVEEIKGDYLLRADLRDCLDRVYDLERLAGRIAYGNANARDLVQLRLSLEAVPDLKKLLLEKGSAVLARLAEGMDECADIAAYIASAIVDDPPVSVREGGLIRPGYDAYLDKLHTASREGKNWIAQLEQAEREATGIRSLKVGFNKVFGYYIEVSRANLSLVPEGRYERKQTLANAERFITPELKEKEALILEAEEKMVELEYQLFSNVRAEVAKHIPRLQALAERVAMVDVLQSFATVSEERGYVRPKLAKTGECVIRGGRHPVVEAVLEKEKYVPNDVEMDHQSRQILLITGPNMAGKSTYMRQIALIVVMAQIGCFVPASEARLALVDQIFTRIGAADDLAGGHSTFMVEMLETKHALVKATAQSLILLDEIGRGTSTYDGMALAQAVIEYIHENIGAKTLFSTHYHELTRLEEILPRVVNVNARCEERDGKLLFLHKIEQGRADKSYGIHVAELADMPQQVIQRAREILAGFEAGQPGPPVEQMSLDMLWGAYPAQPVQDHAAQPAISEAKADVLHELVELDLMQMTPLDAMLKLHEWKKRLKK